MSSSGLNTTHAALMWLGVSKSGYYEWRSRPESATAKRRQELKLLITKAFDDSDGTYGHWRIWRQLGRWGVRAGAELVRALMRELGLMACQPRPIHCNWAAGICRSRWIVGSATFTMLKSSCSTNCAAQIKIIGNAAARAGRSTTPRPSPPVMPMPSAPAAF